MESNGRKRFALVCEGPSDERLVLGLTDRMIRECVPWIHSDDISNYRSWHTFDNDHEFLSWTAIGREAKRRHIRIHGFVAGRAGEHDAAAARRAIRVLMAMGAGEDAIILSRDTDNDESRRLGLQQAREESPARDRVLLAAHHTKSECWVLAGFEPVDDEETARLAAEKQDLGFDPRTKAHQLTANDGHKKSAKRVLRELTGGSVKRERPCWRDAPLPTLHGRGAKTGLADYLDEVEDKLIPLFKPNQN